MLAIEQTAKQWIDQEFAARKSRRPSDPNHAQLVLQLSPAKWVLPQLLHIVYQNTDQPVAALAPLIQTMLQEQVFTANSQDPCDADQLDESINQTVALLLTVLERVRRQCMIQPKMA